MKKATLVFLPIVILVIAVADISAQLKRAVSSPEAPTAIGPYSQAIVANGFIFAAGQIGIDPKTGTLVEGVAAQTEQALKNLEIILKTAGGNLDDVVKITVFLADINDFEKMNEVFVRRLRAPFPARSTVQIAKLPRDARIEIEAIALNRVEVKRPDRAGGPDGWRPAAESIRETGPW